MTPPFGGTDGDSTASAVLVRRIDNKYRMCSGAHAMHTRELVTAERSLTCLRTSCQNLLICKGCLDLLGQALQGESLFIGEIDVWRGTELCQVHGRSAR